MKKEINKSTKKLKKAIAEGVPEMSHEVLLLSFKLSQLKDTLAEYEKYKAIGVSSIIKKYETKLESVEGLIDKRYWDEFSLFYIITAICCRVAGNLDEAITMLEKFNKE